MVKNFCSTEICIVSWWFSVGLRPATCRQTHRYQRFSEADLSCVIFYNQHAQYKRFKNILSLSFLVVCGASVLHSQFWPLPNKTPGQRAALQPGGGHIHQHQPDRRGQSGAAGQGPVPNGEWHVNSDQKNHWVAPFCQKSLFSVPFIQWNWFGFITVDLNKWEEYLFNYWNKMVFTCEQGSCSI